MDILQPHLVWIGNRCYRKTFVEAGNSRPNYAEEEEEEEKDRTANELYDDYADESCDIVLNIESTNRGYRLSMPCPSVCFGLIIGKKGETKRKIENETRTEIRIPRQSQKGNIEICGQAKKGIESAHTRITVLIETGRNRQPFSHFISFPMVSPNFQAKFEEFKEDVLRFCDGERGVDSVIFQNHKKLHLTVGILTLLDEDEVARAKTILESCCNELISSEPLFVDVRGLEYMNDDPNAVDVLYAKLSSHNGSDRLQSLADSLVDRFVASGLMKRQYDRVKLHITVMNTILRKEEADEETTAAAVGDVRSRNRQRERETFDARKILKLYGNYDFGKQHISAVHLSQRLGISADGYYPPATTVRLP